MSEEIRLKLREKLKEYDNLPWWAFIRKYKVAMELDSMTDVLYIALLTENKRRETNV